MNGVGDSIKIVVQQLALKTSLVWKGSHKSFSMFPPARKMMVTSPISTQEKMKLIPTPLWRTDTLLGQMRSETKEL